MKRSLFFAAALLCGMAMFTACEDDETASSLTVDMSKTATVTGYAFADLDLKTLGKEYAPTGTKLVIKVTNSSLLNDDKLNGFWSDTIEVMDNGKFTFDFPIGINDAKVSIIPVVFEASQTQAFGASEASVMKKFTAKAISNIDAAAAVNNIQTVTYTGENVVADRQLVVMSGEVKFTNMKTVESELAANLTLDFYNDGWYLSVTTDKDGKYSIKVPYGQLFTVKGSFEKTYTINDETVVYTYKVDKLFGEYTADTKDVLVDFGKGIKK